MKKLLSFCFIIIAYSTISAQNTERLLNNVVQISTTFSGGRKNDGFGFVVGEKSGILYFATAKHVVQSEDPQENVQKIEVRFYSNKGTAVLARKVDLAHGELDMALLEVPKPDNYSFVKECLADFAFNDQVWFIGRNKDWYIPPTERATGSLSSNSVSLDGLIKADINSIRPGTSGAPMINASGIIALIIEDEGDEASAIEINLIREVIVKEWKYPFQLTKVSSGYFTDQRDDTRYKWIHIGDATWMAENMKFASPKSFCYDDRESYCKQNGRLYTWEEIDTICPSGWRIPAKRDFDNLLGEFENTEESAFDQLVIGSGNSGFSAIYGGWRSLNGNFNNRGDGTYFWTSSKNKNNSAWALSIDGNSADAKMISLNRNCGLSVRCIKK